MQKFVAMLRGINVSGQKIIKMEELRAQISSLGFSDVKTYIQSGNIVFDADETDQPKLARMIHQKILDHWGFEVPVVVKNKDEFKFVVNNNPYLDDPEHLIERMAVTYLEQEPDAERIADLRDVKTGDDVFQIKDAYIFLYYPNGMGRSKLDHNTIERKLKIKGTTRNWKTTMKLWELVSS